MSVTALRRFERTHPEALAAMDRDGVSEWIDALLAKGTHVSWTFDLDGLPTVTNHADDREDAGDDWYFDFVCDPVPHWRGSNDAKYFGYTGVGGALHPHCHEHGDVLSGFCSARQRILDWHRRAKAEAAANLAALRGAA